jgi:hypothetical protein
MSVTGRCGPWALELASGTPVEIAASAHTSRARAMIRTGRSTADRTGGQASGEAVVVHQAALLACDARPEACGIAILTHTFTRGWLAESM